MTPTRRPVTTAAAIGVFVVLAACNADPATNPLAGPFGAVATLLSPEDGARKAAIELAVKDDFDAVLSDIARGGGAALTRAFAAARVPEGDRPARALQLRGNLGLYADSPGALVNALALYGA